jgi:hypothetical protein
MFFETFRINEEAVAWILTDHSASVVRRKARASGRNTLYDLVVKDAFQHRLDLLSIVKLQAAL